MYGKPDMEFAYQSALDIVIADSNRKMEGCKKCKKD